VGELPARIGSVGPEPPLRGGDALRRSSPPPVIPPCRFARLHRAESSRGTDLGPVAHLLPTPATPACGPATGLVLTEPYQALLDLRYARTPLPGAVPQMTRISCLAPL
jgi:hypothetical protein